MMINRWKNGTYIILRQNMGINIFILFGWQEIRQRSKTKLAAVLFVRKYSYSSANLAFRRPIIYKIKTSFSHIKRKK